MTAEKTIANVCAMLRAWDGRSGDSAAEDVINAPHKWVECGWHPFYPAAARMLIDARQQMDRKVTSRSTISAVRRILTDAPHLKETFHAIHKINGKYCACDGYRAVRLNADIKSLPHSDDKDYIDLDGAFPKQIDDEIAIPDLAELKAAIAADPGLVSYRYKRKPFCLDGKIWVNAKYLLDMLLTLPGCKAYMTNGNSKLSPVYFKSDDGDGILLPVRPPREAAA